MRVREIMTEPPLTCTSETSLAVAARLMGEADEIIAALRAMYMRMPAAVAATVTGNGFTPG